MPKVSVLMPVYNTQEAFLRETIDSVLSQSFRDFEFLIINDASVTNVRDVILSYDDPRIVYVENEKNLGISATSNKGIGMSRGEYIARQDHDDISEPNRLLEQVRYLDSHPETGVCGCFFKVFPEIQKVKLPTDDASIKIRTVTEGAAVCHPAAMIRKNLLTENGIKYQDAYRYAEDYQLWVDLLDKTCFHNIPRYLFRYRWFGGNASVTAASEQAENALKVRLNALRKVVPACGDDDLLLFAKMYQDKKYRLDDADFNRLFPLLSGAYHKSGKSWEKKAIRRIYRRVLKQTDTGIWWHRWKWKHLL